MQDADPDAEANEASGWSRALLPLLATARVRLLLSGTLERADGRGILWLPYRRGPKAQTREVDLAAEGWAVVGYSRAQALAERAVLPVTFGALDGEARWLDERREVLAREFAGGAATLELDGAEIAVHGPVMAFDRMMAQGRKGLTINRFKGLGEMDAKDLKDTTMNPASRKLIRVSIDDEDGGETGDLVERLMGKKPELRFQYISENAQFVEDEGLDV